MTEKRYFKKMWEEEFYIFDSDTISESDFEEKLEYQLYKAFENSMMGDEVVSRLNELHNENKKLKQELQKIYEIATVNKVRDIVENVYDDLLYETSEKSNYARTKVLKCLEDIDNLRDDLE